MRRLITFSTFALSVFTALAASGPNQKFLKETAKKVWSMNLEQFNPQAELNDSMFADASAVYIAVYESISANMEDSPFSQPMRDMYIYENNLNHIVRKMVKINDESAIESFSEFTFQPLRKQEAYAGHSAFESEEAFGARIYKPDGTVVDVDMSATLAETSGKKGKKNERFKIAIPGLEVGDVLDYYRYFRFFFLGNQKVGITSDIMAKYPIKNYTLDATFDDRYTIEVNSYNGLDIPTDYLREKSGEMHYQLSFEDIRAFDSPKWFSPGRQMPFLKIYIIDNISRLFTRAASARNKGMYVNLVAPVIMREISEYFAEDVRLPDGVVRKVNSLVSDYRKLNPEANDREIADAGWLATIYTTVSDPENSYNEWQVASIYKDVMDKQKLETPVCLAVTSSRADVDIEKIGGRHRATPFVFVGEVPYMVDQNMSLAPGEVTGDFLGEKAFIFNGKREELFKNSDMKIGRLPKSTVRQNSEVRDIRLSFPEDLSETVNFEYTSSLSGTMKEVMGDIVNVPDYLNAVADYFNIPEKKRHKRKYDIVALNNANKEILESMVEADFGISDAHIDSAKLLNEGFMPASPVMQYSISGSADGQYSFAGDDIIFNIGRFGGNFSDYKDLKDDREVDIITSGPSIVRCNVTLIVPDDYYVNLDELEGLKKTVNTKCGLFFSDVKLSPEGNVEYTIQIRNPSSIYSYSQWGDFLAVKRAAAESASQNIVLHKK
ncbi:MAG: DUF3857 domain-containing protein [Muribaculaceae bacterium]|nr:DUF3857 domain-containing protein [Muribaculaceae bacterium]